MITIVIAIVIGIEKAEKERIEIIWTGTKVVIIVFGGEVIPPLLLHQVQEEVTIDKNREREAVVVAVEIAMNMFTEALGEEEDIRGHSQIHRHTQKVEIEEEIKTERRIEMEIEIGIKNGRGTGITMEQKVVHVSEIKMEVEVERVDTMNLKTYR